MLTIEFISQEFREGVDIGLLKVSVGLGIFKDESGSTGSFTPLFVELKKLAVSCEKHTGGFSIIVPKHRRPCSQLTLMCRERRR